MTRRTRLLAAYALAVGALAAVFTLYTQPEMLVTLSEQIWACFN